LGAVITGIVTNDAVFSGTIMPDGTLHP